jgi:hypothetical protein
MAYLRNACHEAGLDTSGTREEVRRCCVFCRCVSNLNEQLEARLAKPVGMPVTLTNWTKWPVSGWKLMRCYRTEGQAPGSWNSTNACDVPANSSVQLELPAEAQSWGEEAKKIVWQGLQLNAQGLKW